MSRCEHSDEHAYLLVVADVGIEYCRYQDCQAWLIEDREGNAEHGSGLAAYQEAITERAERDPDWRGAAFLYGLGGHAQEVIS